MGCRVCQTCRGELDAPNIRRRFSIFKDGCYHIMSIAMNYANPFVSDMEDWGSVHNDADLMSRVLEKVEEK